MHQTRKGKQWYCGMKAHVGVDSKTKMVHTVVATAAEFGTLTRLISRLAGPVLLWTSRREERQLEKGKVYEPPLIIERCPRVTLVSWLVAKYSVAKTSRPALRNPLKTAGSDNN